MLRFHDIVIQLRGNQDANNIKIYGITIRMYFLAAEHNPPHIHVIYGEDAAEISISTGELLDGSLPNKAMSITLEWLDLHREELAEMWESQEFRSIPPLE